MKRPRKSSSLVRAYLVPLIPILCATILTGTILGTFVNRHSQETYERENIHVLDLVDEDISGMLGSMDYYYYFLWSSSNIRVMIKRALSDDAYSYSDIMSRELIRNFVNTHVNTQSYLYSAYVYYTGYPYVLVSESGVVAADTFFDQDWLRMINGPSDEIPAIIKRSIRRYAFQLEPREVLSITRRSGGVGDQNSFGIVTLNLAVDEINQRLSSFLSYEGQYLLVCDEANGVLFQTDQNVALEPDELSRATEAGRSIWVADKSYYIYDYQSKVNGFRLYSLVPTGVVNRLQWQTIWVTLTVVVLSALFGLVLLYFVMRRRYGIEKALVSIVEYYEATGKYPEDLSIVNDDFDHFYSKILSMFNAHNEENRRNYEREIKLEKAELMALQAQINPHFLYNTLEVVSWKTMEVVQSYTIINEMIENLSAILHYSLSESDRLVVLAEEIDITKRYIRIQTIRYGEQFSVSWDYDESCSEQLIPKLTFQPILENAVQHGVISRYDGSGEIRIAIRQEESVVRIVIADNGAGIDERRLAQVRESLDEETVKPGHIGLANTNQRIKLLFGDEYGLTIESHENVGTWVTVVIPKAVRGA